MSVPSRPAGVRSRSRLLLAAMLVLPSLVLWRWIASVRSEIDPHPAPPSSASAPPRADPAPVELERPADVVTERHADPAPVAEPAKTATNAPAPNAPATNSPAPTGSIVGLLRPDDANLEAVARKVVTCTLVTYRGEPGTGPDLNWKDQSSRSIGTSARGEFHFDHLAQGDWDIVCDVPGYLPGRTRCTVQTTGTTHVELVLVARHVVVLYLTDDAGNPIENGISKDGSGLLDHLRPF